MIAECFKHVTLRPNPVNPFAFFRIAGVCGSFSAAVAPSLSMPLLMLRVARAPPGNSTQG